MESRRLNNLRIINELNSYALLHPELRFIQILWNLNVIDRDENLNIKDRFYEEPEETLKRVMETIYEKYKASKENEEIIQE